MTRASRSSVRNALAPAAAAPTRGGATVDTEDPYACAAVPVASPEFNGGRPWSQTARSTMPAGAPTPGPALQRRAAPPTSRRSWAGSSRRPRRAAPEHGRARPCESAYRRRDQEVPAWARRLFAGGTRTAHVIRAPWCRHHGATAPAQSLYVAKLIAQRVLQRLEGGPGPRASVRAQRPPDPSPAGVPVVTRSPSLGKGRKTDH